MMRPILAVRLLLLLLPCLAAASASQAASLTIAPAETTVTVGDAFTLRVVVDAVPDLKGADLVYGYTAGRLTFTGAGIGDAIAGVGGATVDFVLPDVTAPPDSVWYDAARLTDSGSGPGVVAFLHFASHTQGNATVACLTTDLRDSANMPLDPACAGALVHVVGPVPTLPTSWGRLKAHFR